MPRYSFMWYEQNKSRVSFDAPNLDSAMQYFEDLENGKIDMEDLPKIKGMWKSGQTEYVDLRAVDTDPDPDKIYKEGLENGQVLS